MRYFLCDLSGGLYLFSFSLSGDLVCVVSRAVCCLAGHIIVFIERPSRGNADQLVL